MKLLLVSMCFFSSVVFAGTVSIKPFQEKVDVYVRNADTQKLVKVGPAPVKMSFSDMVDNYAQSQNFEIVLKKENYFDYRVMVSKLNGGNYEMKPNLESIATKRFAKKYDKLIDNLFDVQRLIRSQNYKDATSKLDKLEEKFPEISAVYEMKAMNYYMAKDLNKSLSYYRKAASVDPENKEVYTMKKYLEKELNVKGK